MIYEFITPSDAITFKAECPKVAFYCGLILGRGKAGVTSETGERIPCLMLFCDEQTIDATILEQLGGPIKEWQQQNLAAIADCFESFAYGSIAERRDYDAAIEAITDPDKLAAFKAHHEDKRRTSMSRWVDYAWKEGSAHRALIPSPTSH